MHEPFALAQFEDLREDEQLARPSFEPLEAGLTFALDEVATDEAMGLSAPIAYETLLIDPTRPPERPKPGYVLRRRCWPESRPSAQPARLRPANGDAPGAPLPLRPSREYTYLPR